MPILVHLHIIERISIGIRSKELLLRMAGEIGAIDGIDGIDGIRTHTEWIFVLLYVTIATLLCRSLD